VKDMLTIAGAFLKSVRRRFAWATIEQAAERSPLEPGQVLARFILHGPREGVRAWRTRRRVRRELDLAIRAAGE
jgi:hypothetical protein